VIKLRQYSARLITSAYLFPQLEGLVLARVWGFESPLPHHSTRPLTSLRPRSWQATFHETEANGVLSERSESKGCLLPTPREGGPPYSIFLGHRGPNPDPGPNLPPSHEFPKLVSFSRMSPTDLRVERYRFFFFSNEGHESAHVHVQDGERLATFWLDPVVLAASTGFAPHEITRIHSLVIENRGQLLEAWHEFFRS
jgi:hypothetical protein